MRASRFWLVLPLLWGAACNSFDTPGSDGTSFDVGESPTPGPVKGPRPQPPLGVGGSTTLPAVDVPRDDLGAACDRGRGVTKDGLGLIVRDPDVLAAFPLTRTLQQIISAADVTLSPDEFLQRLFDTENTTTDGVFLDVQHCDSAENLAFAHTKAVDCPRAEGRLAKSTSMLTPGAPDFFAPVALVNRFDLATSDRSTCGEYHVVYAKQSGRSAPQDRLFLSFDAVLFNSSGSLSTCRPVADLWAELPSLDVETKKARLSALYFEGLGDLSPVLSAVHLSANATACAGPGRCGQIRIGQQMQAPFQFRQFRLQRVAGFDQPNKLLILPTASSHSPRPQLWDLPSADVGASAFRQELLKAVPSLSTASLARVAARLSPAYDAGESAVSGAARPNYAERLAASPPNEAMSLAAELRQQLGEPNLHCPSDDPLTPEAIVQRATALTCAGCHAPAQLLAEGRKVGCGSIWPQSLGETHINEQGELSEALTSVFLPHRAEVLTTFLQACDFDKVEANLQFVPPDVRIECFPPGTPITLANGKAKPIEQVEPSEWVLTFDPTTRTLVPAQVTARIVRQDARRFVRINDALVATDNHPFFTATGWVRAMDLELGATLLSLTEARGTAMADINVHPTPVERLTLEPGAGLTYNLHVDTHHSYFAGGMLVHDRP